MVADQSFGVLGQRIECPLLAVEFDVVAASMGESEERRQQVDFTAAYYRAPAKFLRVKGSGVEWPIEGGLRPAPTSGRWGWSGTRSRRSSCGRSSAGSSPSRSSAVWRGRRQDGRPAGRPYGIVLEKVLFKNPDTARLELAGPDYQMPDWPGLGLMVRKGDDKLRAALNAAIAEIARDGTYHTIQSRYFGYDVRPQ